MKKQDIPGITGYANAAQKFIEATLSIDFTVLHKDFLPFFPKKVSSILDIGAGIGRDAFELSNMGHWVTAIEPVEAFRNTGKTLYNQPNIEWISDALPELKLLDNYFNHFDFILASGVWHHLNHEDQNRSLKRIVQLLNSNGIFALTLRNGPAGVGTCVFSTNGQQTIEIARQHGLVPLLFLENQPSLIKNKENVFWMKLVFQKPA